MLSFQGGGDVISYVCGGIENVTSYQERLYWLSIFIWPLIRVFLCFAIAKDTQFAIKM